MFSHHENKNNYISVNAVLNIGGVLLSNFYAEGKTIVSDLFLVANIELFLNPKITEQNPGLGGFASTVF